MIGFSPLDTIQLFAAGSLRAALTDVAEAFETNTGHRVRGKFGPSGLLKEQIAGGAKVHVFASANMEHPASLHSASQSGPVLLFARNRLCALVRAAIVVDSASLLDRMLDPSIKLGTSTPQADPSGDYACAVFRNAEAITRGARATLEAKALQLTGNSTSTMPPPGCSPYGWHRAQGRADIFLCYRTAADEAQRQYAGQQTVELPKALAVGADYGLTVIAGAPMAAQQFADFVIGPAGQDILVGHGFTPGKSER